MNAGTNFAKNDFDPFERFEKFKKKNKVKRVKPNKRVRRDVIKSKKQFLYSEEL